MKKLLGIILMQWVLAFCYAQDPSYPTAPATVQNIVKAEYFIDADPGIGKGLTLPVTNSANVTLNAMAITVAGLTNGVHRIGIRTLNNEGAWSQTALQHFIYDFDPAYPSAPAAVQHIVSAEYFIDSDPGTGSAQAIALNAAVDLNDVSTVVNTGGLANGIHRVYMRVRSQEGKWSLVNVKSFTVDSDPAYPAAPATASSIVAAEYFIDTDPGAGAAQSIPVVPGVDIGNIPVTVNTSGLHRGAHNLYIRTRNQEGKWSINYHAAFFTDALSVTDTLHFGTITSGTPVEKDLVLTNNSAAAISITSIAAGTGLTTNTTLPLLIPAGGADTISVQLRSTNIGAYFDSLVLNSTAGSLKTYVQGFVVAEAPSWSLSPATGHQFGSMAINSNSSFNFTITNTGNGPVTLSSAETNDPAFTVSFTPGTIIPVNGSIMLPVQFSPAAVQAYSGQVTIKSSTSSVGDVTAVLNGNGYAPGTPPVLQYVPGSGYAGTTGVNPASGQQGNFTYKVLYKSSANKAPMTGYPRVSIDSNGDQDFNDLSEGTFTMIKEDSGSDYVTGVVYSFTYTHNSNTHTAGYQFQALDADGNAATSGVGYVSGPVVSDDVPDLRLFANDISFSMLNPAPGQTFTMTARISNSSAVPATNIPISFYRDTILLGTDVLAAVGAYGSSTISRSFNFPDEGFYPIKVWIDSAQTLGENNILNNYAIRPVTVGSPVLPGEIRVSTTALRQECPQLQVLISGSAVYFGTGTNEKVAGAEVTINTGLQTFKTTTDANGNFSQLVTGVSCGSGNFAYAVTVTDFTFTSQPASFSLPMPCPPGNACTSQSGSGNSTGGIAGYTNQHPCANVAGTTTSTEFVIRLRDRNINNFWSGFDYINHRATLYIFHNEVLVETREYGAGLAPGEEIRASLPLALPSGSTTPIKVSVLFSYTYVEFSQIPNATHHGHFINITESAEVMVTPQPDLPDLTADNIRQTSFTSFTFNVFNTKCVAAGSHVVKIFDNGVLVKTESVTSLGAKSARNIGYGDPHLAPGLHLIRIEIDADNEVEETDETNNVFEFYLTVVPSDLTVTRLSASPTSLTKGAGTHIQATIKNAGKTTSAFNVKFMANGVQVGAKKRVNALSENGTVEVQSDTYTVSSDINDCGETITVVADSDNEMAESNENNNDKSVSLSADLVPQQLPSETGSAARPAVVRINEEGNFFPAIRNVGLRDAAGVRVRYLLNGVEIGKDSIQNVRVGEAFASYGAFTHRFDAVGDYSIHIIADPGVVICELDENNNTGTYHIRVVDSKADFEVLSQYVSPSSLNPQPEQYITIVGTVRNRGGKISLPGVMRFYVDDIQLGNDVAFNAIQPGKDTTVQATVGYASATSGVKLMKIVVDPDGMVEEEIEWNNEATRNLIVGAAPDIARKQVNVIRFNPSGFTAGDSVLISYDIINNGTVDGSGWVRFMIFDESGSLQVIDSIPFSLAAGAHGIVTKKMLFEIEKGMVIAEIANCSPIEYDFYNNADTLHFSTVASLTRHVTINANLDMKMGIPEELPGWIGGKLLLGNHDLVVNGNILNSDEDHFIVTNGTGKLKLVNNNSENVFPVAADESHGNFVKITNAGTPDNFSVRVVPWVLQGGTNGDTVKTGNVNRTWFVEEQTNGGSNVTLQFLWNANHEQPAFDRLQSRAAHHTGSWQLGHMGAALQDSLGRYSKTQAEYTSFSPFTVTSINAALPLRLLEFKVTEDNGNAQLHWKTTDETNTSHFTIEHSTDGRVFAGAGRVKAYNSAGEQVYQFDDPGRNAGTHYYRLRMVDLDGTYTYSDVQKIVLNQVLAMGLYPNPATSQVIVSGIEAGGYIQLFTIEGKRLRQWATGGHHQLIQLNNITKGVYIIQYQNKVRIQQLKFIKE